VYPLSQKVAGGEREADAAAMALAAARRDHTAARQTVTGKVTADEELKKFYGAVLPPDFSSARKITDARIAQMARKAGVTYEAGRLNPDRAREGRLGKLTATVMLTGDYRSIRRLIHDIETAPEFLILENVALSQGSERNSGLNVTIDVSTYYRAGGDEQ
jgi:Tfp pilus assembly protein PilO